MKIGMELEDMHLTGMDTVTGKPQMILIVMEKGKIVEQGDTETVFKNPKEEYTRNLISSVPVADPRLEKNRRLERMSKAN